MPLGVNLLFLVSTRAMYDARTSESRRVYLLLPRLHLLLLRLPQGSVHIVGQDLCQLHLVGQVALEILHRAG